MDKQNGNKVNDEPIKVVNQWWKEWKWNGG